MTNFFIIYFIFKETNKIFVQKDKNLNHIFFFCIFPSKMKTKIKQEIINLKLKF